jgi:hypothetical protein
MPEAEVALRMAEYLLGLPSSGAVASVAIDGACVKVHGKEVFPVVEYLAASGWRQASQAGRNSWGGVYERKGKRLEVHSRPGVGDVVAEYRGRRVVVECKKGWLTAKRGSPERPLLLSAIGQAVTGDTKRDDLLAVAVPDSVATRKVVEIVRERESFKATGIAVCLVARSGDVSGFPLAL